MPYASDFIIMKSPKCSRLGDFLPLFPAIHYVDGQDVFAALRHGRSFVHHWVPEDERTALI